MDDVKRLLRQYAPLRCERDSCQRLALREALLDRSKWWQNVAERAEATMRQIEVVVDALDGLEREVVRMRYFNGKACCCMRWRDVCIAVYGKDDETRLQAVYRAHKSALQKLEPKMREAGLLE